MKWREARWRASLRYSVVKAALPEQETLQDGSVELGPKSTLIVGGLTNDATSRKNSSQRFNVGWARW